MSGVIARYRDRLPVTAATPLVSLNEGSTPLIESVHLAGVLGLSRLAFKFEGLNPTGSFKDRGMVVAVAKAIEEGKKALICASTGNTSASAAAYGARCGLPVFVVVPAGKIASGKLAQAQVFGATVVEIEGNFDEALALVREIAATGDIALVNSVNPYRIEGQKTAAFEIVDERGSAPDVLALPVGNAGNITAYWRGFREYASEGKCEPPQMVGAQASGAAPIVRGAPVEHPETVASAIRIGNPASWKGALAARDESGGWIDEVDDEEILAAQRQLADREGIFCEPASAAGLALVTKSVADGRLARGSDVICVLTGNGLKDPNAVAASPPLRSAADKSALAAALGLS